MDEILRSQNSTAANALNGIASSSLNPQSARTTHFSLALADPVDTVSLSDEARSEFQNLQKNLSTFQGYKKQLQDAKPAVDGINVSDLDASDLKVRQLASPVATDQKFIENAQTFGSSEDFVAQVSMDLDQKSAEFISWNNNTYQLGRNIQSPYGVYSGASSEMSDAWAANIAQPQAARAYAAMSMQTQSYAALAPNGTGISLRI
ncbi:MAG: hypothetical protein IJT59_06570 [Desulfovibrionaceae bacterium]|nr:hypothetical protein [Desulfovibrionaceae bacterium]